MFSRRDMHALYLLFNYIQWHYAVFQLVHPSACGVSGWLVEEQDESGCSRHNRAPGS